MLTFLLAAKEREGWPHFLPCDSWSDLSFSQAKKLVKLLPPLLLSFLKEGLPLNLPFSSFFLFFFFSFFTLLSFQTDKLKPSGLRKIRYTIDCDNTEEIPDFEPESDYEPQTTAKQVFFKPDLSNPAYQKGLSYHDLANIFSARPFPKSRNHLVYLAEASNFFFKKKIASLRKKFN